MLIAHTSIDPDSGSNRAVISGVGIEALTPGQTLRCAAYRFQIVEVQRLFSDPGTVPTAVVLLAGLHRPINGMQVHLVSRPLTVEEVEQAVRHLVMVPRLLLGLDAATISQTLAHLITTEERLQDDSPLAVAARALEKVARATAEATLALPAQVELDEIGRVTAELTDLIAR